MRSARDADAAATDLGDRLASGHVIADGDERRLGVPVVDVAPGVLAAVDLDHGGVGTEAVDALLDDRARGHGDLDDLGAAGVPDCADVDTVILGPVSVSYTHLRAHETVLDLVCRLLLE